MTGAFLNWLPLVPLATPGPGRRRSRQVGTARELHLSVAPARSRVIFVPFMPLLAFRGSCRGQGGAPHWTNDLDATRTMSSCPVET
jgi:hypothetical protein